jgi:hypothetical protein
VVLVVALIDLFCSEWIYESYRAVDSAKSLVHFGIKVSLKVGVQICAISEKLTLHQFAFQAALFCLFTVALCLYLI